MNSLGETGTSYEEQIRWWREKVARSLASKRERLRQPGFQVFAENWLLISDFPPLDDDRFAVDWACRHLGSLFAPAEGPSVDFEPILIHSGNAGIVL